MWKMYILSLYGKQKLSTMDEDFRSCGNQNNHVSIVYHVRLCQVQIILPTLALKPRRDVTRSPKQGYQWPQKWTCLHQKF